VRAVAAGEISPGEAADLGKAIDLFLRSVAATDFDERLSKIEARINQ
jgi:hypothetical protein